MIFLSFHLTSCSSYLFRSCWAVCLVKSWLTRCSFRFPHAATIKRRSGGGRENWEMPKKKKGWQKCRVNYGTAAWKKMRQGSSIYDVCKHFKNCFDPHLLSIRNLFIVCPQISDSFAPPPLSVRTLLQVGPQETMRIAYTCTRIFNDGRGYDKTCLNWTALQSFTSVGPHFTSLEAENGSKCQSPLRSSLTGI